ncbi:MAG: galactose-1-phosphate uridylyltransferase [Deltaproteobacteria bacterium]|jgi:UDPglucose--hexose-1-phosphate uridylyltransferase|nr:galactose-1-phosphate uridylyltransferase [Deltaproteobacteria bacterium]MBW2534375.1 galactose-1-phosphate uridylyltransferase [Deltaproteobacteria bacterium]
MSELRQNLATGDWVVVAPERLKGKPLQSEPNPTMDVHPTYDESCPFCPPNEPRFPHVELAREPHPDGESPAAPWITRAIENKYKIFQPRSEPLPVDARGGYEREGIYAKVAAEGSHELVLESPIHNRTFATMSHREVEAVVDAYLGRFRALRQIPGNLLTILFKNHGPKAGASQLHPHGQILSSRLVPNFVRYLLEEATRYFDAHGRCVFCTMIDYEREQGARVVYENERFIGYVPYAQPVPYEMHLTPKKHDSLFEDMSATEAADFADCLRACLGKLYDALSNPDFNLILRNPPHALSHVPFYHWYLQVVPHTRAPGGFERGSRIMVNVVSPEAAAKHLREVSAPDG